MFWIDLVRKDIVEICVPFRDASNYLLLAHVLYTIAALISQSSVGWFLAFTSISFAINVT